MLSKGQVWQVELQVVARLFQSSLMSRACLLAILARFDDKPFTHMLCSISYMISLMCSIPTETLTISGATPRSIFSCGNITLCVVDQGWIAVVLASPYLKLLAKRSDSVQGCLTRGCSRSSRSCQPTARPHQPRP